jgi:hypothetical protein
MDVELFGKGRLADEVVGTAVERLDQGAPGVVR